MKLYNLEALAAAGGGEYVLGARDLDTHACYMIYGALEPLAAGRLILPGRGHEEIFCAINGPIIMHTAAGKVTLPAGHAVHLTEDQSFTVSNPSDQAVVYVVAGGHSGAHH
jgi:hypothetical protein